APALRSRCRPTREADARLAHRVDGDLDLPPPDPWASDPQRLHHRFLGRKPSGEPLRRRGRGAPSGEFCRREDAAEKYLAPPRDRPADPIYLDDIDAEPPDHVSTLPPSRTGLALGLLRLVDEHRRNIILDRIPPPAFGTHHAIPLLRDGRLARRTGEDLQQLLVDHILALLSAFIHST